MLIVAYLGLIGVELIGPGLDVSSLSKLEYGVIPAGFDGAVEEVWRFPLHDAPAQLPKAISVRPGEVRKLFGGGRPLRATYSLRKLGSIPVPVRVSLNFSAQGNQIDLDVQSGAEWTDLAREAGVDLASMKLEDATRGGNILQREGTIPSGTLAKWRFFASFEPTGHFAGIRLTPPGFPEDLPKRYVDLRFAKGELKEAFYRVFHGFGSAREALLAFGVTEDWKLTTVTEREDLRAWSLAPKSSKDWNASCTNGTLHLYSSMSQLQLHFR